MKRTPLQRHTPLHTNTPLRRVAGITRRGGIHTRPKPMSDAELYARMAVTARSGGWCELRLPGCEGRATDWCHRLARGRGGKWTAANGMAGCRSCHRRTTDTNGDRDEFEWMGFTVRTGIDPATVPVWLNGERWVRLDDEGGVVDVDHGRDAEAAS